MTPPKPFPLACAQCGKSVPSTARNYAYVLCADCIPPQFQPSRRRLTQAEFDAEQARARTEVKPLRTRSGRRRSWWQRGWKRNG